jgi:anti-anti-sigma factor
VYLSALARKRCALFWHAFASVAGLLWSRCGRSGTLIDFRKICAPVYGGWASKVGAGFMTSDQTEIPLAIDDGYSCGLAVCDAIVAEESPGKTSLESERFGLLASPTRAPGKDRRVEEWIASNLDLNLDLESPREQRSPWIRLIDGLSAFKRPTRDKRRLNGTGTETSMLGWSRFRVAYKRGATVVRLLDKNLVKEAYIRELACDLLDLIEAGNHRVVLNFQAVERLASWVVVAVDEARRLCAAADGGALRICGLPLHLASIFPIAGVEVENALYMDEATALDTPWPEASRPRALPIEILSEIIRGTEMPPSRETVPSVTTRRSHGSATRSNSMANPQLAQGLEGLWLLVQAGSAKGRSVPVSGSRYAIGRDRTCELRLTSPKVSKFHAAIERRESGGIVIQDLGSTNGTYVNGQILRSKETTLNEGDRIQIGPVVVTVSVGPPKAEAGTVDEMVATWLNRDGSATRSNADDSQRTESFPIGDSADSEGEPRIRNEVIQDVLVLTPLLSDLDDDESIELLREHLHTLYDQPTPRHVVVNLECVRHLNAQAIGVLLAHHLRLDREGGALRICQAHARLMAILHHVRLTILVECHPTLDEAVLAAWPAERNRPSPPEN